MSDEDSIEEEMRALLRLTKINVTKGNAKDFMRIWPIMQMNKPEMISKLKSAGIP